MNSLFSQFYDLFTLYLNEHILEFLSFIGKHCHLWEMLLSILPAVLRLSHFSSFSFPLSIYSVFPFSKKKKRKIIKEGGRGRERERCPTSDKIFQEHAGLTVFPALCLLVARGTL